MVEEEGPVTVAVAERRAVTGIFIVEDAVDKVCVVLKLLSYLQMCSVSLIRGKGA